MWKSHCSPNTYTKFIYLLHPWDKPAKCWVHSLHSREEQPPWIVSTSSFPRTLPHYLTLTATSVNTPHLPGEIPGPSWPPGTCLAFKIFKDILKHPELFTCKLFSSLAGLVNVCSSFGNSFRHPLLAELCQELLAPFPLQVERRVAFFVLSANPVLSTPWMSMRNICFLDYELPEGREHVYSSLCALWLTQASVCGLPRAWGRKKPCMGISFPIY